MQKEKQLKSCCKKSLSSPKVSVGDLPHLMPLLLLNRKQQPYSIRDAEDPGLQIAGMTNFFNNGASYVGQGTCRTGKLPDLHVTTTMRGIEAAHTLYPAYRPCGMTERVGRVVRMANAGFTLIELLVVVLIIGILAAVAVPQYQFAVDKSKIMSYVQRVKDVDTAEQVYYLANGEWATTFDALDIDLTKMCPQMTWDSKGIYCSGVFFSIDPTGNTIRYYLTFCPQASCGSTAYTSGKAYVLLHFGKDMELKYCHYNNQPRGKRVCDYFNKQFK